MSLWINARSVIAGRVDRRCGEEPRPFIGLYLHPGPAQLPVTVVKLSKTARYCQERLRVELYWLMAYELRDAR
jgi:hypothetical protein